MASAITPPGPALPSLWQPPSPWGCSPPPPSPARPQRDQPLSSPLPLTSGAALPHWAGGVTSGASPRTGAGEPTSPGRATEPAVPWGGGREKDGIKVEVRRAESEKCPGRGRRVLAGLSSLLLPLLGSPGKHLQRVLDPLSKRREGLKLTAALTSR